MIHLTNDAVQKNDEDYGKYELANKLSYDDFQKYLDVNHKEKYIDVYRDILPQIRAIIADSLRAVYGKIDPYQRANTFEILGYDFMIDEDFKIYLIEVNTNP
jgi:D-alanine-D-alanine ligase-like ATP-grasp enzyme